MASSEKVVMNLEDFEGSDGTVRHAMDIWSARRGPINYNQWQSLYFGLVRSGFKDTEAVEDEGQSALQDRIRRMYRDIQSEHHGSDHAVQATIESRPMSPAECPWITASLGRGLCALPPGSARQSLKVAIWDH